MGLQNNFWEFVFFKFFLFIWKSLLSRLQKSKSEISKVNSLFLKNSRRSKMDRKSLNDFPDFWPRDSSYCSRTSLKFDTKIKFSKFILKSHKILSRLLRKNLLNQFHKRLKIMFMNLSKICIGSSSCAVLERSKICRFFRRVDLISAEFLTVTSSRKIFLPNKLKKCSKNKLWRKDRR